MLNVSEATVSDCYSQSPQGKFYWTAGKRADTTNQSEFVWRVGAQNYSMAFHNWHRDEPSLDGGCVNVWEIDSYSWNDLPCTSWHVCSVCEFGKRVQ